MSLDRRIKKGLQSPTIKVDLALVMVVVRDDHNKFISKCNHVRRYRNSHRPARYLSVFLVLSTRQLKISTPVLLFATGGLPAHVAVLERALRHELLRLGTTAVAVKVHIGSGNWSLKGQSETWSTHRKSVMDEVVAHPPCEAVIKMRVDEGRTSGWCVCLKGSLQSGCLWPGALCGCQTATEQNAAKIRRLISQLDMASRHPIIAAGRLT
jgi:hypothetical protein